MEIWPNLLVITVAVTTPLTGVDRLYDDVFDLTGGFARLEPGCDELG
jgi:hypothetical protein